MVWVIPSLCEIFYFSCFSLIPWFHEPHYCLFHFPIDESDGISHVKSYLQSHFFSKEVGEAVVVLGVKFAYYLYRILRIIQMRIFVGLPSNYWTFGLQTISIIGCPKGKPIGRQFIFIWWCELILEADWQVDSYGNILDLNLLKCMLFWQLKREETISQNTPFYLLLAPCKMSLISSY